MKKNITLIIPAAGLGSRFRDTGILTPKPLIEIGGIPMILWVIYNFKLEANDHLIIIGKYSDNLESQLKTVLSKMKFKVTFIEIEKVSNGAAQTVSFAFKHLEKENAVIVANSDQFIEISLLPFLSEIRGCKNAGEILTMVATGSKWSYVRKNSEGLVIEVKEKEEISKEATVGIYAWSEPQNLEKSINAMINSRDMTNSEYYVAPSYNYLLKNNLRVGTYLIGDHGKIVNGIGTPEDLKKFVDKDSTQIFLQKIKKYYEI